MTHENWIVLVGNIAACCTTLSFVPQIVKIWKQGGRDVSYGMFIVFALGCLLWLIYGLLTKTQAVIIANAATGFLVLVALALKFWKGRALPS